MKFIQKILSFLMIFSLLIVTPLCATQINIIENNQFSAIQPQNVQTANNTSQLPQPDFTIYSEGAVLMDSYTGKVLYGKNQDKILYPASTTKILTAIIAIENCQLTDKLTASYEAVMSIPTGYSNAAIQPGETLAFQDLLDMFLIHSANEIGYIFAEHISGNIANFATLMNQKASELGCKNTHFTNPSGIHDKDHYSTAYDMALIARYCMQNQTFRDTVSKVSCSISATDKYQERFFRTTNDLIDPKSNYYYEYATGCKTGFTSQAKNCLIGSASKDNLELITVALGAEATSDGKSGRYVDTLNLFNYGFENYKIAQIATANSTVKEIVVENGTKETQNLDLLIKDNLNALIPSNLITANLNGTIQLNDSITAPIAKNDVLGKITYDIDGILYSSDLIANHSVEEFNLTKTLKQIVLALFIIFILAKLLFSKKKMKKNNYKRKNKKSKNNRNYKNHKNKRSNNSIYKF